MTVSTLLLSAALVAGCGGGGNNVAAVDDAGPPTQDAAAPIGTIVHGTSLPCTEAHSICLNVTMPATLRGQPTMLQFDLYSSTPPTHPPEGIPVAIPTPGVQSGETVQLRMTDVGLIGSYFFLGLLFMPGGGSSFPVSGIDYIGNTAVAYPFTGAAINIPETVVFADFN